MADTDIIVSQMPNASQVGNSDLVMLTQPNAQAETGYSTAKTTVGALATKVGNGIEFVTDLSRFNDKTLTGAINENKDSILDLLPVDEVSGAVANFETDVVLPLIDVKSAIVATDIGSGSKTPENPYIVGGFTGVNLYQRGANLWDEQWELGAWSSVNGGVVNYTDRIRCKNAIPVAPNTTYCIRFGTTASSVVNAYDANGNFISNLTTGTFGTGGRVITTPSNCYYIKFSVGTAYGITYNNDISVNYPSTDTEYHAYNPNSSIFPVSWQTEAGEVFGGEVDVTNGKLVVTHHGFTLTGAEEEGWTVSNTGTDNYYYVVSLPTGSASAVGGSNVANIFPSVNVGNNNTSQGCYNTASALRVRWGTEMTVADWKTWLGTNNLTVVYKLATPIEYDLSDTANISALVGVNNVWSDTNGDTTVDYKLGIQAYIDKKIAEVQALVL